VKKVLSVAALLVIISILAFAACKGGGGPLTPDSTASYIGSAACQSCHREIFTAFNKSGHPYKLTEISDGKAPKFPFSEVPSPPAGNSWADIAYVIGGFAWKARFIGTDGYIITGGADATTQYNLATRGWVPYHAGEQVSYDCGNCHTTGYNAAGNQDGLPGLIGTWAEEGVQCEACHGPGSDHAKGPKKSNINVGLEPAASCSRCHIRDDISVIDASGGFIKHHEQYEEILQSPHAQYQCTECHDPHRSAVYRDAATNPNQGIVKECAECHEGPATFGSSSKMDAAGISCEDCHMPPLVKSAVGNIDTFTGDVSTHLFRINTDASAPQFNADGTAAMGYITIQYACQYCHIEGGTASVIPLEELRGWAENYHMPVGGDKYVGSQRCSTCHSIEYNKFIKSGHPYKLNEIVNSEPPEYPYSEVPNPPAGYSWADVSYVIGGFGWKARFIGLNGYIITGNPGDTTQYNLETQGWVDYHSGEQKPYDCGACHTTGYDPVSDPDGLEGLIGTWEFEGVQCEACHGAGGAHVNNPSALTINLEMDPNDRCALCHIRGDVNIIDASGGFTKHHEQYEELLQSPHNQYYCSECHDPHASAVYEDAGVNPNKGLVADCASCHPFEALGGKSANMTAMLDCMDCHMPPMVKSAVGDASIFTGDISSHLFRINTDAGAPQFSPDGTVTNPYVTISFACQYCHIEGGTASVIPLNNLAAYAVGYHSSEPPEGYVGQIFCAVCHPEQVEEFGLTGHAHDLNHVSGAAHDYPYSDVPNPPAGNSWADVSYVIGGYGWKANFMGLNGYIITGNPGDTTQYNLASQSWVGYHAGEQVPYTCGACHTTGYDPDGHQDGLQGIVGSWEFPSVECEACHGMGGEHVANPSPSTINLDGDPAEKCMNCHARGNINVIEASGGFTSNYTQANEMLQSPHNGILDCTSCHDPHMSSQYEDAVNNPDKGLTAACEDCHPTQVQNQKSANMAADITCMDCHMAPMVKSATGNLATFTADLSSHLWTIETSETAEQFANGGTETNPYITVSYACQRCHIDGGGASIIPLGSLADYAVEYHEPIDPLGFMGDDVCASCHPENYDKYIMTGHPHILEPVSGGVAPDYPYSDVPNPPAGYSWNNVSYVIGGFGWKALFMGLDGYIITGTSGATTQYNLETMAWDGYHDGETRPYDCGACHTTGYVSTGHQDDLPGIIGEWDFPGVQCEACHGYGGTHVMNPNPSTINLEGDPEDRCSECHIRGDINIIDAADGFIRNHEQSEEMLQSPHNDDLTCTTCHDPHLSALYEDPVNNPNKGLLTTCANCHSDEASKMKSPSMAGFDCEDCHMPPMVMSATGDIGTFTADIAAHLWEINVNPAMPQFSPDGTQANPYITVAYACQRCHIAGGSASAITYEALAAYAAGYHEDGNPDEYVGSVECSACHEDTYIKQSLTGHAYILNFVSGPEVPDYPYSSVPNPPSGFSWGQTSFVIGGYGWKANFIGLDGYIITGNPGDTTQYNLKNMNWVEYHPGETLPYDCGACHTTGYTSSGNQYGLPGLIGTWNEDGVRCEACHGPGGLHVYNPSSGNINLTMDPDDACSQCHSRGDVNVIDAADGFILNHEQYEEFLQSPHEGELECTSCHDPHASVLYDDPVWNPDKGLVATCEQCHQDEADSYDGTIMDQYGMGCIDCHMVKMAYSATSDLSIYTADVATHLIRINTSSGAQQFDPSGTESRGWITVTYACLNCHYDGGPGTEFNVNQAAAFAHNFHN